MNAIRQAAKGQRCQVRLIGICNNNPETVVLAHYRLAGTCGTGLKPPDYLGAFACSSCHDAIDERIKTNLTHDELRLAHAEAVFRTQVILFKNKLIQINR